MAKVNSFEELKSWQKARLLCSYIFKLTKKDSFKNEFSLKDQIKRSSGSVMDNIAEGFDRRSSKEFRRFLLIAKGSASEVKSQLYRAIDQGFITDEEFRESFQMAVETSKMIGGLIKYLDGIIENKREFNESPIEYESNALSTINYPTN